MKEKLKKIGIGALVAGGGAILTYVIDNAAGLGVPPIYLPAVTAVAGVALNALRKFAF